MDLLTSSLDLKSDEAENGQCMQGLLSFCLFMSHWIDNTSLLTSNTFQITSCLLQACISVSAAAAFLGYGITHCRQRHSQSAAGAAQESDEDDPAGPSPLPTPPMARSYPLMPSIFCGPWSRLVTALGRAGLGNLMECASVVRAQSCWMIKLPVGCCSLASASQLGEFAQAGSKHLCSEDDISLCIMPCKAPQAGT